MQRFRVEVDSSAQKQRDSCKIESHLRSCRTCVSRRVACGVLISLFSPEVYGRASRRSTRSERSQRSTQGCALDVRGIINGAWLKKPNKMGSLSGRSFKNLEGTPKKPLLSGSLCWSSSSGIGGPAILGECVAALVSSLVSCDSCGPLDHGDTILGPSDLSCG